MILKYVRATVLFNVYLLSDAAGRPLNEPNVKGVIQMAVM